MAEQDKKSGSLPGGALVGALVCAVLFFCIGMSMGIKWNERSNQAWYDRTVKPVE